MDILASRFKNNLNRVIDRTREPMDFTVDALVIPWIPFRLIYTTLLSVTGFNSVAVETQVLRIGLFMTVISLLTESNKLFYLL